MDAPPTASMCQSVVVKNHLKGERPWNRLAQSGWISPSGLVTVALANKMARIVWALLAKGEVYKAPVAATV